MSENPKNILLIMSKFPPEYSGPGVRMPKLYNWLKEKGENYNVQVLCNGVEQIKNEKYLYQDFPVRRITAEYLNQAFSYLKIIPKKLSHFVIYQYEFFKTLIILFFSKSYRNTHLLHILGHSGGTAAGLLYANLKKIPVLMELVTEQAMPRQKVLGFFNIKLSQSSIIVALTKDKEKTCLELGYSKNKIWYRPNPIDENKFFWEHNEKYNLRKKFTPFNKEKIIISNVAKIIPQKNQFLILRILKRLPSNYVAVIAGPFVNDGPFYERDKFYLERMKDYISVNDLGSRVFLKTDFVESEKYMKLSDIYLMPAYNEGFGTPMLEAMGCGLPVIANKSEKAFCDWIENNKNGFLCDIENSDDWVYAVQKLALFSKTECSNISQDIHERAGQKIIYQKYKGIIKDSLKGK